MGYVTRADSGGADGVAETKKKAAGDRQKGQAVFLSPFWIESSAKRCVDRISLQIFLVLKCRLLINTPPLITN